MHHATVFGRWTFRRLLRQVRLLPADHTAVELLTDLLRVEFRQPLLVLRLHRLHRLQAQIQGALRWGTPELQQVVSQAYRLGNAAENIAERPRWMRPLSPAAANDLAFVWPEVHTGLEKNTNPRFEQEYRAEYAARQRQVARRNVRDFRNIEGFSLCEWVLEEPVPGVPGVLHPLRQEEAVASPLKVELETNTARSVYQQLAVGIGRSLGDHTKPPEFDAAMPLHPMGTPMAVPRINNIKRRHSASVLERVTNGFATVLRRRLARLAQLAASGTWDDFNLQRHLAYCARHGLVPPSKGTLVAKLRRRYKEVVAESRAFDLGRLVRAASS